MTAGLDLLIVPAFAFPAIPYNSCSDLSTAAFETGLYNVEIKKILKIQFN